MVIPKIFEASFVSFVLISAEPLVPSSPLVKSTIPTFFPWETNLAIVAPHPSSTSSGWAPKAKKSNVSEIVF